MSTATDRRVNRGVVGLANGFTITLTGLFTSPLTGGSLNPARSLAPALLAEGPALASAWIYCIGPLAGSLLGALVYEMLRGAEVHAQEILKASSRQSSV